MLNEKRKAKNSNKPESNEAVKLSYGLGCLLYLYRTSKTMFGSFDNKFNNTKAAP